MTIKSPAARSGEAGQTIIFVAIALISLVAMAALAIDVVTLYVAKTEAQRAADAAAIAGATAFVSSGASSVPPSDPNLGPLATNMANSFISAALNQNNVAGSPPTLVGSPTYDTTRAGNPHVTVTVQQTNLPTFFSRIWGRTSASVQATATAEAYNSSSAQNLSGANYVPVTPKCVKPILVANANPQSGTYQGQVFVGTDGTVNSCCDSAWNPTTQVGFIGQPITLTSGCPSGGGCPFNGTLGPGQYLPGTIPAGSSTSAASGPYNNTVCPGDCANLGGSSYQQSIACCDTTLYDFSRCSSSGNVAYFDKANNPDLPTPGQTQSGLQCVIHTSQSTSYLPDTLTTTSFPTQPFQIQPGTYTQSALSVPATSYLSTSDSIITVPLINPSGLNTTVTQVTIVGFLQIFVSATGPGTTDLTGTILNVIGCGNSPAPGTVAGGGVSPVPVRLITPP